MKVEEGRELKLIIDYCNKSDITINDILVTVNVPEGMEVREIGSGKLVDNKIIWSIDSLTSRKKGSVEFSLVSKELESKDKFINLYTSIESKDELTYLEDDLSYIKVMIYSNRFTKIHKRYIEGYSDGSFGGTRNIIRAEIATIFARLLDLDVDSKITSYKDIKSNHWAIGYIEAVSKEGLMEGYGHGIFAPDQAITRAEFATIIARYLSVERDSTLLPIELHFNDITNNWAKSSIEEIYRFQIVDGYDDGTFRPDNPILRSEAVTMINKMLYRGPIDNDLSHFNDVNKSNWYYGQVEESAKTHEFSINPDGTEKVIRWIDDIIK